MSSKQSTKAVLRVLSERAIGQILGEVPRKFRRSAGRIYANAAYQHLQGIEAPTAGLTAGSRLIVDWVAKEYTRYVASLQEPSHVTGMDAEESTGDAERSPASGSSAGDSTPDSSPALPNEG